MKYYPVNIDVSKKKCLVVGGGATGTRKVKKLLECGADITVVSVDVTKDLHDLWHQDFIILKKRQFKDSDIKEVFLVIAATNNNSLNYQICVKAKKLKLLCNIVDSPVDSNFIIPAVVNRGDLIIAISTSGKSPALAKILRKRFEKELGEEYTVALQLLGNIREKLLKEGHAPEIHKNLFNKVLEKGLIKMIKEQKIKEINFLIGDIFGNEYKLNRLGF